MAAIRTINDLCDQVAVNMNFLRPGQTLGAREAQRIKDCYANTLAELVDKQIGYWRPDEIPAAIFLRLAWLISIEVAPAYGALPIVLNAIQQPDAQTARSYYIGELREHVAKNSEYVIVPGDYF